jgi:multidrug resistance efflux pump
MKYFRENLMRTKLLIPVVILVSVLLITSMTACSGAKNPTTNPPQAPGATAVKGSTQGPPGGLPPGGPPPGGLTGPSGKPSAAAVLPKTVAGDGTISVANYANLYFGSAGQIEKINVKAGDSVAKGMVLALLDTTSLEANLAQAQVNLSQAQLAKAQAKVNLDQAQVTLVQTKIALDQAYLVQLQAESSLAAAQFNLDKVQAVSDIKDLMTDLQQHIAAAEVNIQQVKSAGNQAETTSLTLYRQQLLSDLEKQQTKLSRLLSEKEYSGANSLTYDIMGQIYDRLTVQDARMKQLAMEAARKTVEQSQNGISMAQKNIDKANDGIVLAQMTVDKADDGIALAEKNVALIKEQLNQATMIAPFDGVIANINQNERDNVPAPAQSQKPIIYLVDASTMQLNIGVNELDIAKVKSGQKAAIIVDAFPEAKLEGKVTTILPLPAIQGGIVDYTVTITFAAPAKMNVMIGMHASASIVIE